MKRYLLFYSEEFYPAMGFNDLQGDFEGIQECHDHIKVKFHDPKKADYHIFDLEKREIVFTTQVDFMTTYENKKEL